MSLRDVFVAIGMDIDDSPLAQLDRRIDDVISTINGFNFNSIDNAVDEVEDLNDEFEDLENSVEDAADQVEDLDNSNLSNLDREVQNTDGSMNIFKKTVLGLGAAIMALGIGAAVKEFTQGAIEAAAGAQALQAQFDQVFGADAGEAQGVVENLGESFGMLPNRIKPAYTQMTSLFKGLGLETGDAMDASQRAVSAVADAAAFYDKSFEDANSALNSFIKGNYEGGEAIGLFANETQLAGFATKELGLDWKNLGEADKQLARLTFAEKMMESAGATGQALRESESYENQLGNLKQAWQDFLAKAGAPILEQAVGVLSKLSDVISNVDPGPFMEFVSAGFDQLSKVKDIIDAVYNTIMSLVYNTGEVSDIWQNLGVPPEIADGIASFAQKVADGFNYGIDVILQFVNDVVIPLMPVAQEFIGNSMGVIANVVSTGINIFSTLKSIVQGVIEGVIVPLFPVARSVIETSMNVISPILRIVSSLFSGISSVVRFLVEEIIVPLLPLATTTIKIAWIVMKPILDAMKSAFDAIADAVEWVIEKIGAVGKALKKLDIGSKISGVVSNVSNLLPGFEVGLGRVPYDEMPALLHKDEAVLPAEEAGALRSAGILKGDGTNPSLDFGNAGKYNTAATVTTSTTTSKVHAPVQIFVQGGNTNDETVFNIKEAMEEFFGDLNVIIPQVREG
ncbi:phage tail protein [Cytobacillus oceanisediminis]|uniref:Phage-related protein n=1 Tax=Cytobacillus oceanisediminis TaxID=665099 RepID=A0ABX3CL77_9BACI|nr:hypothetical protein [Cytobacillus oceanisediminis]OHX41668.1 hypothetical protein BBV17_27905 [Cytobacillus oceanisediminis]